MKFRAPAKVNLRLRVVGKRKDGFHLLDTIMVPVSLYDDIVITDGTCGGKLRASRRRIEVTCDNPLVPSGKKNLAYKAASLLMQQSGIKKSLHIHINKRIPVGAGLGGGSSDAAVTLVGLNRLFGLGYSMTKLEKLSLSLGADVPFFIRARPARARGIGERLTPLRGLPPLWMVILYPGFSVSSGWAYRNLRGKLTKTSVNTSITRLSGSWSKLATALVNDLETVVIHRYPGVAILKQQLASAGAIGVLMSGSGSSVFGIFKTKGGAKQAFHRVRKKEGTQAFLVQTLNLKRREISPSN